MVQKALCIFVLVAACFTFSTAQKALSSKNTLSAVSTKTTTKSEKMALNFGNSIMKAYANDDCGTVYNALAAKIISMETSQAFNKTDIPQADFCGEKAFRSDMAIDYTMYMNNYQQKVMTATEVQATYPKLYTAVGMQEGDFLFDGSQKKSASSESLFRASDMAVFIIRKVGNTWEIIAM